MKKLLKVYVTEKGIEKLQEKIEDIFSAPKAERPFNLPDWMVMIMSNQEALNEKLDEILCQISSLRRSITK